MNNDIDLRTETFAERRRLVALLSGLTDEQWSADSLCADWRIREVVAHITLAYRHSSLRVIGGIIAARGNFNRFSDRIAHRDTAAHSDTELLDSLLIGSGPPVELAAADIALIVGGRRPAPVAPAG